MNKNITKNEWIDLFKAVGITDDTMQRWHCEFERRAPEAHQSFLEWLEIPTDEIAKIRTNSRP